MPTPLRSSSHRIAFIFCFMLLISSAGFAQVTGAVFTSEPVQSVPCSPNTCVPDLSAGAVFTVNSNLYPAKIDVFLNGGPKNDSHAGIDPSGPAPGVQYYFQVTDPSGTVLLSADPAACRIVDVVQDSSGNGRVDGLDATVVSNPACPTRIVLPDAASGTTANPVQMCPPASGRTDSLHDGSPLFDANNWCDNTPNPGGEYKAFLILASSATVAADGIHITFSNSNSQTDNFKVQQANAAYVDVCKFNDENGNGTQDPGEPFISHWPIDATGVDTAPAVGFIEVQTDDDGCVQPAFSVTNFPNPDGSATVTLVENLGEEPGWVETAPLPGTYDINGNPAGSGPTSVLGFTETITVTPGQTITAPNFGNTCVNGATCGGNTIQLIVTKDANPAFTRTFTWGITKSVDNTLLYTAGGAPATFNYTVNVTHTSTDSAWVVNGSIRVANPSFVDVTSVNLTDTVDNGGNCTITDVNGGQNETIPAQSHVDFPYTCTYTSAPSPSNGTNTATAISQSGSFSGTAPFDFNTVSPTITDGSVNVTDTLGGTLGTVSSTDPSPTTFMYSKTFNDPAGTCTTHPNTATFTTNTTGTTGSANQSVQDCQGANLTVSKTATATYNSSITKSVDKTRVNTYSGGTATFNYTVNVTTSGWTVTGNITVTNPNNWEAVTVNLADSLTDAGGLCSIAGGNQQIVPASGSISPAYTCTFAAVPNYSSGSNTATVTWNAATASTTLGQAQWTANYTFNPLTVTDTFNGTTTTLGTVTIPPGSATFTYAHTVTAPSGACATYNNTAQITGGSSSNQVSVMVCGASDLTVTKMAAGAFNSGVSKSVNQTTVQQSGGNITFNYTVTATESAWTVSGNISVSNPNNWEPITATVTDALTDSGGACTVNGGSNVVAVSASSTSVLPYTCTFAARPSLINGTNTATGTWSSASAYTKDSSASYMAGYSFNTLTITDNVQSSTYPGGCNATLGTLSVTTTTPSASPGCGVTGLASSKWGVFTYSITDANSSPGTCSSYNNTAQIAGGSSSNRVTVTACNTNTGALTMGFWKNTNGQKIIKAGSSTGGVCNLTTYLRGYNSFDDLSATASCSAAASYVASTIGAATCGGSTCNPMLKAQMLATALDVFFSTPGLGGNQIGAYNGLGAKTPMLGTVAINLSNLCSMIDGTSSSTCSGSYEDVRPEFGINGAPPASCQAATVSTMLAYSDYLSAINGSPVSNSGGTTWYKQIKNPNQVYAKDGFDNVNNDIAPIATGTVCTSSF